MAIALDGAYPCEIAKLLLSSFTFGDSFVWIVIFNLVEGEIDLACKANGFGDGFWCFMK